MRFLVMCLVIVAVVSTVACGGNTASDDGTSAADTNSNEVFEDDFEEGEKEEWAKDAEDSESKLDTTDFEDGETPPSGQE